MENVDFPVDGGLYIHDPYALFTQIRTGVYTIETCGAAALFTMWRAVPLFLREIAIITCENRIMMIYYHQTDMPVRSRNTSVKENGRYEDAEPAGL